MTDRLPVRIGILGAATIGQVGLIQPARSVPEATIAGVGARDPNGARAYAKKHGLPRAYNSYDALLADPEIDAIYNPLPNSLHAEWTIKALKAGKHVLCEKPLAVTALQGLSMMQTARERGMLLMEAFMYRFHPQTVWALEQVAAGRVGQVKFVCSSFSFNVGSRPHDIRLQAALAGGSLMDVGCYAVNFCRAAYGHTPIAGGAPVYTPS